MNVPGERSLESEQREDATGAEAQNLPHSEAAMSEPGSAQFTEVLGSPVGDAEAMPAAATRFCSSIRPSSMAKSKAT